MLTEKPTAHARTTITSYLGTSTIYKSMFYKSTPCFTICPSKRTLKRSSILMFGRVKVMKHFVMVSSVPVCNCNHVLNWYDLRAKWTAALSPIICYCLSKNLITSMTVTRIFSNSIKLPVQSQNI